METYSGAGRLITGEVVKIHVAEDVLDSGRIITQKQSQLDEALVTIGLKRVVLLSLSAL